MNLFKKLFTEDKSTFKVLIVWLFVLSILYSLLSIIKHMHFQSGGFDLGIFDQAVWQYSKFLEPYSTIKEMLILGDHLTLTLPLLAPLFYIWDDVRMLLIFQAFWLTFASVAVYKLCQIRKFSPFVSLILTIIYSLFYSIQFTVFFDFHPVIIAAGLFPWLAYFIEVKNKKLLIITTTFILLTQENMGIAVISLAVIYLFKKEHRKIAFGLILTGIIYSIIALATISRFSTIGYEYKPKIESNPAGIVASLFDKEEKLQSWGYTLSSFSFLPLLYPPSLLSITIDFSQYYATGPAFSRMWSPFTHHRVLLSTFVLLGALEALLIFKKRKTVDIRILTILLLISALFQQYYFHFPLNKLSKADFWKSEDWMNDNRNMIASIPKKTSLATQQNLVPHLSHRKEIYIVYPKKHDKKDNCINCWWLDFAGSPELLLVDRRMNQWITQILSSNEGFQEAIINMENAGKIEILKKINDTNLYKINY